MDEQHFLNEIKSIPWEQPAGNDDYRNALLVFAGWLEERGDPRSELIRLREGLLNDPTPMQRQLWEPRMQELIHNGVQPIQATWQNSIGMKFCWCPLGKFVMGSPETEEDPDDNQNQVDVTLTQGYWLGKYVVTQSEWERAMGTKPWSGQEYVKDGSHYPATCVDWDDAMAYLQKLSEQSQQAGRLPEGWDYRLPTEAQWEYACRAGTTTAYYFGNDAGQLSEYAWHDQNALKAGEEFAHVVGEKRANGWGQHDMYGNVWEWCQDWYTKKLAGGVDPRGAIRHVPGLPWRQLVQLRPALPVGVPLLEFSRQLRLLRGFPCRPRPVRQVTEQQVQPASDGRSLAIGTGLPRRRPRSRLSRPLWSSRVFGQRREMPRF